MEEIRIRVGLSNKDTLYCVTIWEALHDYFQLNNSLVLNHSEGINRDARTTANQTVVYSPARGKTRSIINIPILEVVRHCTTMWFKVLVFAAAFSMAMCRNLPVEDSRDTSDGKPCMHDFSHTTYRVSIMLLFVHEYC